jgi:hypothetical protein
MWEWIKGILLPRGGVGGIRIFRTFSNFCIKVFNSGGRDGRP